jgi:hypothetical protein
MTCSRAQPATRQSWARGKRAGPGGEVRHGLGRPGAAPGVFVPYTQPAALQLTLAGHHATTDGQQRAKGMPRRVGVEVLPADTGAGPGPPAPITAPVRAAGRGRAARGPTRPRRGQVVVCRSPVNNRALPSHSPGRHTGSRCARNQSNQPAPPGLSFRPGRRPRPGPPNSRSAGPGHRYCSPAATAATARRLSSSRACR